MTFLGSQVGRTWSPHCLPPCWALGGLDRGRAVWGLPETLSGRPQEWRLGGLPSVPEEWHGEGPPWAPRFWSVPPAHSLRCPGAFLCEWQPPHGCLLEAPAVRGSLCPLLYLVTFLPLTYSTLGREHLCFPRGKGTGSPSQCFSSGPWRRVCGQGPGLLSWQGGREPRGAGRQVFRWAELRA